jgi:leucyl-tRNA synthetase
MKDDEIVIPVQVNGKTRCTISISVNAAKDDVLAQAKEALGDRITGTIRKEIYVPKKIVNIVAK